jgi:hypothetical protein
MPVCLTCSRPAGSDCTPLAPLMQEAQWFIDARAGAVDLSGSGADPVPMTASLLDPADGAVQVVSLDTNEGGDGVASTGSYLWTADSAANSITGDIDIRALCRAFDDATNDGAVPQTIKVAKYLGDVVNTFDYLFSILTDGDLLLGGSGLAAAVAASESMYGYTAYRITRVASSGLVTAYVEDPDGAVTTADGRTWTSLGTTTDTTGALDDTANAILTFMIGKGVGGWCQVYDGIDGTLVVDMDIERDATAGLTSGDTFVADTGETWTLNEKCATFAVDRKVWAVGSTGETADGPFAVPDAPSVNIGTGDFTVACVYEPSTLDAGTFRLLMAKFNPATIGTTGVGWGFVDYSVLGGLGFVINDGGGLESGCFTTWDAGERHLLVATGDRDGSLSLYVDDMITPADTTVISDTTGTLTNAIDVVVGSTTDPALFAGAAIFDRLLTQQERNALPYLLAA